MATPRVYADFQNLDDENRLRLTCAGTRRDLERQGIELKEGMVLTLYTDDATDDGRPDELLAEGVVHYDNAEECWVATIDWQAIRHASQISGVNGGVETSASDWPPADPTRLAEGLQQAREGKTVTPDEARTWFRRERK
jgi:hypothetical protein